MSTATLTPVPEPTPRAIESRKQRPGAFGWVQLVHALPGAVRELNPAALWRNPVMFLVGSALP